MSKVPMCSTDPTPHGYTGGWKILTELFLAKNHPISPVMWPSLPALPEGASKQLRDDPSPPKHRLKNCHLSNSISVLRLCTHYK